ncbi:MAG TPA: hypothetical protein VJ044_18625 [Candidatus Hodarchaeales archaeon]|nr:hypothetical protein [Candidatus Hodarchaeales archaeon]
MNTDNASIQEYLRAIEKEYRRARTLYPPFHSYHEGYAILLEELDEFWEEIKKKRGNLEKVENEITQVGAMALAILVDLVHKKVPLFS